MGLADLHVHTIYSYDGTATVPAVLKQARQAGLDLIAITDHDEIRGALLAEQLAPQYNLQVIPGVEITTAEGDLLALNIRSLVPAGLPLIETLQQVGALGGFCIAPHPTASSFSMKSLSAFSIRRALQASLPKRVLVGIETYNATAIDRECNTAAGILAESCGIARTGSSDAHVLTAIGLGATFFPGKTPADLLAALWTGSTRVRKGVEWGAVRVLGNWLAGYLLSIPAHLNLGRLAKTTQH
jgi:predicted metal-dependent phosphoesterase TrpH